MCGGTAPFLMVGDKLMADKIERKDRYRGWNDQIIPAGSIDPLRDTVYKVGGSNPYGPGNYYSQSQLNNNMSGNDANAIYYATHDQRMKDTVRDNPDIFSASSQANKDYKAKRILDMLTEANDTLVDYYGYPGGAMDIPANKEYYPLSKEPEHNDGLYWADDYAGSNFMYDMMYTLDDFPGVSLNEADRLTGHKPHTAQQYPQSGDHNAYVTGADAVYYPNTFDRLDEGMGTTQGIPDVLLDKEAMRNMYAEILRRALEDKGYSLPIQ